MWRRWFARVDQVWLEVTAFLSILFFVFLADAVFSDFVPAFMQRVLGSPLVMGIVMSTSSAAGLVLDLLFAKLLRGTSLRRMVLYAIAGCMAFGTLLMFATVRPWLIILIPAMMVWGLYYEFFGFSGQKFVVDTVVRDKRSMVWGVMFTIQSLAYALGPLLSEWLLQFGDRVVIGVALVMIFLGVFLFLLLHLPTREPTIDIVDVTLLSELSHWRVLFLHMWPILVLSVLLGLVDATFWTTGTVVTDELAKQSAAGSFFLTTYMIPSLLVGFVLARWHIVVGKKKRAEWLVLLNGLILAGMFLFHSVWWYLIVVFVSSFLNGIAWPLVNAVYTDLLARAGRERKHMMGLQNSTSDIAYVVGPILAGWLAQVFGELGSFIALGWIVAAVSLFLLFVTPKKLKLPQTEIASWE